MTVICKVCGTETEGELETLHEDYCEILLACGHTLIYQFHKAE